MAGLGDRVLIDRLTERNSDRQIERQIALKNKEIKKLGVHSGGS